MSRDPAEMTISKEMYEKKTGTPFPAVGQVWRSRDPREAGRTFTITNVGSDRVYFTNYRGETRSIAITRLHPWGLTKGYEFVR